MNHREGGQRRFLASPTGGGGANVVVVVGARAANRVARSQASEVASHFAHTACTAARSLNHQPAEIENKKYVIASPATMLSAFANSKNAESNISSASSRMWPTFPKNVDAADEHGAPSSSGVYSRSSSSLSDPDSELDNQQVELEIPC